MLIDHLFPTSTDRAIVNPVVIKKRFTASLCALPVFCASLVAQPRRTEPPLPNHVLITRHTFFDFGPPSDYYQVFLLRQEIGQVQVERITAAPPGLACMQPATVQVATTSIEESLEDLLGRTNPCTIPEKELRRERKRCKKCLVFSGANVALHVQCGGQSRRIRMDILDRDMFDSHPATPEHTSWTMGLLGRLDQALGSGVMERPILAKPSSLLEDLAQGKLDGLFDKDDPKLADLFRQSKIPVPEPSVQLVSSLPISPASYSIPGYPPLARLARIQGQVVFTLQIAPAAKDCGGRRGRLEISHRGRG